MVSPKNIKQDEDQPKVWYLKIKRYGGGESIIDSFKSEVAAKLAAEDWNRVYQTDTAYHERHDNAKAWDWRKDMEATRDIFFPDGHSTH